MITHRMGNGIPTDGGYRNLLTLRENDRMVNIRKRPFKQRGLNAFAPLVLPAPWKVSHHISDLTIVDLPQSGSGVSLIRPISDYYSNNACSDGHVAHFVGEVEINYSPPDQLTVLPIDSQTLNGYARCVLRLAGNMKVVSENEEYVHMRYHVSAVCMWNVIGSVIDDAMSQRRGRKTFRPTPGLAPALLYPLPAGIGTVSFLARLVEVAIKIGWRPIKAADCEAFFASSNIDLLLSDSVSMNRSRVLSAPASSVRSSLILPPKWVDDLNDLRSLIHPGEEFIPKSVCDVINSCVTPLSAVVLTLVAGMASKEELASVIGSLSSMGVCDLRPGCEIVLAEVIARRILDRSGVTVDCTYKRGYAPCLSDCVGQYLLPPSVKSCASTSDGFTVDGDRVFAIIDGIRLYECVGRIDCGMFAVTETRDYGLPGLTVLRDVRPLTPTILVTVSASQTADGIVRSSAESPLGVNGPSGVWANYSVTCIFDLCEDISMSKDCRYCGSDRKFADSSVGLSLLGLACARAVWDDVRSSLPYRRTDVDHVFEAFPYMHHASAANLVTSGGAGSGWIHRRLQKPLTATACREVVGANAMLLELACGKDAVWGSESHCYAGHWSLGTWPSLSVFVTQGGVDISAGLTALFGTPPNVHFTDSGATLVCPCYETTLLVDLALAPDGPAHCLSVRVACAGGFPAFCPGVTSLGFRTAGLCAPDVSQSRPPPSRTAMPPESSYEMSPEGICSIPLKESRRPNGVGRLYDPAAAEVERLEQIPLTPGRTINHSGRRAMKAASYSASHRCSIRSRGVEYLERLTRHPAGYERDTKSLVHVWRASNRETSRLRLGKFCTSGYTLSFVKGRCELSMAVLHTSAVTPPGSKRAYKYLGIRHIEPLRWYCRKTRDVLKPPDIEAHPSSGADSCPDDQCAASIKGLILHDPRPVDYFALQLALTRATKSPTPKPRYRRVSIVTDDVPTDPVRRPSLRERRISDLPDMLQVLCPASSRPARLRSVTLNCSLGRLVRCPIACACQVCVR